MAIATSYLSLEPSFLESAGGKHLSFNTSDNPTLATPVVSLFTLSFVVIVLTASFVLGYAGVLRMPGTAKGIQESKDAIRRVTIGILFVFSLGAVFNMINRDFNRADVGLGAFRSRGGTSTGGGLNTVVPKNTSSAASNPPIPRTNDDPAGWKAIQDDSTVRAMLLSLPNGGIGVNKTVCNNPTQTSCTTVGGLPPETLSMLKQLRATCPGTITVTGGSETGHKSHGPGLTPVDLSLNSPGGLEACIRAFVPGPFVSFCKKTYSNFGYTFCDENLGVIHWHVYK